MWRLGGWWDAPTVCLPGGWMAATEMTTLDLDDCFLLIKSGLLGLPGSFLLEVEPPLRGSPFDFGHQSPSSPCPKF